MKLNNLREKASKGDIEAQYELAAYLATGYLEKKNLKESIKWYRLAAKNNHAESQWNLGWMYLNGEGIRKNKTEGIKWIKLAAKNGSSDAMRFLSLAYAEGKYGFNKNIKQSKFWEEQEKNCC